MEGAADGQTAANPIEGLDAAAAAASVARLAQLHSQAQPPGVRNELTGNQVIYPVAAQPDLNVATSFSSPDAASTHTSLTTLWPPAQRWPFPAQWIHQPNTILLNDPMLSASNGLLASHVLPHPGMPAVVALHHLQGLQKPLQGWGTVMSQPLDCSPSGVCPSLLVGSVDVTNKAHFRHVKPQEDQKIAVEYEHKVNGQTSVPRTHTHFLDLNSYEARQEEKITGLHLGISGPGYGAACKIPLSNQSISGSRVMAPYIGCNKVNNLGMSESCAVKNNTRNCYKTSKGIAEAFVGKFGEEAFWKMRSLLLEQQEVFISQVWDLHRLQWFQTFLQNSMSPPQDQNHEFENFSNAARLVEQPLVKSNPAGKDNLIFLENLMGNRNPSVPELTESRRALPGKSCSCPNRISPSVTNLDSADQGRQLPETGKKIVCPSPEKPIQTCENPGAEPIFLGSGQDEVPDSTIEKRSMHDLAASGQFCQNHKEGRWHTDQSLNHSFTSNNELRSVDWHHQKVGPRATNEQEVSSSRMNIDAALRKKENRTVSQALNEGREQTHLLHDFIDRAISSKQDCVKPTLGKIFCQPSRKHNEVFRKKKRKTCKRSEQHTTTEVKVPKTSENLNYLMERESIGSGRSGCSRSNNSRSQTAARETGGTYH